MNIALVSHCDFTGNSALHVLAVAEQLQRLGYVALICIPSNKQSVSQVDYPAAGVRTYDEALDGGLTFFDGNGPDVVHAFTPREHVRRLVEAVSAAHGCPYIVHLEDNEALVLDDDLIAHSSSLGGAAPLPLPLLNSLPSASWRSHPLRAARFMNEAAGMTAIIETLLELKPDHVPGAVFWPGFDPGVMELADAPPARAELGLDDSDLVLAYTGNVHNSNLGEIQSLYIATGLLRRAGLPVKLVKTGTDHVDMSWVAECVPDGGVVDLGFVSREELWRLLAVADVLVQPGGPDRFNDYRFPSKLPDFLVSGKPVVLPATNIGRHLIDGQHAILLQRGDATEISEAVQRLWDDPELRATLGRAGREFALRYLQWEKNVVPIVNLYDQVAAGVGRGTAPVVGATADIGTSGSSPTVPHVKVVAFYLPQFHRIPENDEFWGEGFTEWTSVRRGRPQFEGHHQPQLPGELGFYDLRDPLVLQRQAALAREYGVYGFCFYYYWFGGRRVLERPVDDMLGASEPRLPFCFCWANENWTRRWDGLEEDVLLRQDYPPGWADRFIRDVLPALHDRRYITVDGAPLLLVYRASAIPDVGRAVERWRAVASDEYGLELHLAAVQSFGLGDPRPHGFDAAVEFPPHTERFLIPNANVSGVDPGFRGYLEDYPAVMRHQLAKALPEHRWYRGVMPSWDNTARRGADSHILLGSSPAVYQTWLRKIVLQTLIRASLDEPLVFVNAWNEWAEGTHLEPDEKHGHAWLEATWAAQRDGLRQYYANEGYEIGAGEIETYLRDVLPPLEPGLRG